MRQVGVLAKHPQQGWLLIHRGLNQIVSLSDEEAEEINFEDAIIRSCSSGFVSASYEITELCNLQCIHCYLGGVRKRSSLSLAQQLEIIDQIEATGVIWLQVSGGEPLSAPTFKRVYAYAWDRGFLITVLTNGTLLYRNDIQSLFRERPPFRLSVSIYGASQETYERVTRNPDSWKLFQKSIQVACEQGLRLRMKVIELAENTHELQAMLQLAQLSEEYDHVRDIIPTLAGDQTPLAQQTPEQTESEVWSGCDAGRGSFHVMANGMACLCKITREPNVSMDQVHTLQSLAHEALRIPKECQGCQKNSICHACPSLRRLLTMQGANLCARR